ncbi:hypothetical protein E0H80_06600 [Acinetobacter sp. ANC 4779]|uniref:OB-fold protein n=1 Tax=Acinetobacter sp. ANC 4779 TaxID=2529848 RepID=UPI00103E95AA|nr:hypothetical protein [Acinetobacter sp. ANC 4779]TCB51030.1 hypothetical protein E0H80_06600 [Acinetobacter sp. ANC 4779]
MKFLLILALLAMSSLTFASKEDSVKNIIIHDDFTTWLDDGKALFNWNEIVKTSPQKSVTINKIKNDYAGNEVAANKRYRNQWTRIKGSIKNVKIDKDGGMYADLTENYVNFKAYISNEDFASSLNPNQKIDMYCFNVIASSAIKCIDYPNSIWNNASQTHLAEIRNNKGISSFLLIISDAISDDVFMKSCSENVYSSVCKSTIRNSIKDLDMIIDKALKKSCGKSREAESCINLKQSIKDLDQLINK